MARRRMNPGPWVLPAITAIGVALLLILGLNAYSELSERADRARERSAQSTVERDRLAEDIDTLRSQLFSEGIVPEVPAAGPDPVPDEDDITVVPVGPTDAQVRAAVRTYLIANPPRPGRPPTRAEIDAAVAAFCAGGNCVGESGRPGRDGIDSTVPGPEGPAGADSTVPGPTGPRGPGPTDAQVADAVATFCAGNACRGPAGGDGSDGSDGADGRGIIDVTIEGDARECELVITFDQPPTEERLSINGLVCIH